MTFKYAAHVVCVFLLFAPSLHAQELIGGTPITSGAERLSYIPLTYYGVRAAYETCIASGQGQAVEKGDCADEELKYQDGRLTKAYRDLLTGLAPNEQAVNDARAAQRAWLTFTGKDCASRAQRFGSGLAPSTESICMMERTAERAQQLEDWRNTWINRKAD